jgi:hypothetical protein
MSTRPSRSPAIVSRASDGLLSRESISTRTGRPAKRSRKVIMCWKASTVVGHSTAT